MADTKISAMSAASAVADANEFAINEAGTSKKVTAVQIREYCGGTITKKLSATLGNATSTLTKVTNLDQATGTGTFTFRYFIRYQSDTTASGVQFSVNHSGTLTSFVANARFQESTTAAVAGTADQAHVTFGLVSGGAARAKSTGTAIVQTVTTDSTNSDMLMIIEGVFVCTVSGNLELYAAKEAAAAGNMSTMQDSVLILQKIG